MFLVTMSDDVTPEGAFYFKSLVTYFTLERAVSGVGGEVLIKARRR